RARARLEADRGNLAGGLGPLRDVAERELASAGKRIELGFPEGSSELCRDSGAAIAERHRDLNLVLLELARLHQEPRAIGEANGGDPELGIGARRDDCARLAEAGVGPGNGGFLSLGA